MSGNKSKKLNSAQTRMIRGTRAAGKESKQNNETADEPTSSEGTHLEEIHMD